jgi:transposase
MALTVPQIKKALREHGMSYRAVGELVEPALSISTIYKNVKKSRDGKSARARSAIASAIGLSVEDVFGEAA